MPYILSMLDQTESNLFDDYIALQGDLAALAAKHGLRPSELLPWLQNPEVQAAVDLYFSMQQKAVDLRHKAAHADAVEALRTLLASGSLSDLERRRTATTLIRATTPKPLRLRSDTSKTQANSRNSCAAAPLAPARDTHHAAPIEPVENFDAADVPPELARDLHTFFHGDLTTLPLERAQSFFERLNAFLKNPDRRNDPEFVAALDLVCSP
jgi:hypothetical protein